MEILKRVKRDTTSVGSRTHALWLKSAGNSIQSSPHLIISIFLQPTKDESRDVIFRKKVRIKPPHRQYLTVKNVIFIFLYSFLDYHTSWYNMRLLFYFLFISKICATLALPETVRIGKYFLWSFELFGFSKFWEIHKKFIQILYRDCETNQACKNLRAWCKGGIFQAVNKTLCPVR